ncbi:MAG: hypothetical protein ACXWEI_22860, partial [Mycobacterium sp.]
MVMSTAVVGAVVSRQIFASEYISAELCNPGAYEFFNFGFEEHELQDAIFALHSSQSGESTVDLCPM